MSHFDELLVDQEPEIAQLARATRELVLSVRPDAREEVEASWGGYLLFKQPMQNGNTVCYVSAHKKHVSLGFAQGSELDDPATLLQGKGKLQRHVKIKKSEDLENPALKALITLAWSRQPGTDVLEDAVGRIREICLELPGTSEKVSHGHPTFVAGKKSFAIYGIYSPSVAFKAEVSTLALAEEDDRFFPTPYMAHKGWLSLRVDEATDWEEVRQLIKASFMQVASKRLQAQLRQ